MPTMDPLVLATLVLGFFLLLLIKRFLSTTRKYQNLPPAAPGLPLIGNLHQLKEKKPHVTLAKWAEQYGPIYTIRTGSSTLVVLNSTQLAKEAMVTRYSSISSRKLSTALKILSHDKALVAMSDYGEMHKMIKKYILASILGANAQKRHRADRDTMVENTMNCLHREAKSDPGGTVNLKSFFEAELFRLALKLALGEDIESTYVEELGINISKYEIFDILVTDPMRGGIEVDWRDFFPYLRWVPNKSMESKILQMDFRRNAVMKALIKDQKNRIGLGEEKDCYLDFLVAEGKTLTEDQVLMLVWEAIIETSDTTSVATEWAMFELAKNPKCQDRLYQEIREICGSEKVSEEHLSKLPYLNAVFHETLRKHSPAPILPLRHAHEDTELGGFHILAGSEIAINIYGCNMDKKEWKEPEEWKPERFLTSKYEAMDLYKTMAFGGGKRVCAGSMQAMLISCTSIGRFVQEFEWKLKEGEGEDTATMTYTGHKLQPMLATIIPRQY